MVEAPGDMTDNSLSIAERATVASVSALEFPGFLSTCRSELGQIYSYCPIPERGLWLWPVGHLPT